MLHHPKALTEISDPIATDDTRQSFPLERIPDCSKNPMRDIVTVSHDAASRHARCNTP